MNETTRALISPRKRSAIGPRFKGWSEVLNPAQLEALDEIAAARGGLIGLAVGEGKSLVAWCAPLLFNQPRTVILCPSSVVDSIKAERAKFESRLEMGHAYVIGYGKLSTDRDILTKIAPDLIIADEAHAVSRESSARTRRLCRYLAESGAAFVGLSGTLLSRSVQDLAILSEAAFGEDSPIPRSGDYDLARWAEALDPRQDPQISSLVAFDAVRKVYDQPKGIEGRRAALREHLNSTRGVVLRPPTALGSSLYFGEIETECAAPELVTSILRDGELPNGEVMPSDAHAVVAARRAALGFWYDWRFRQGLDKRTIEAWRRIRAEWSRAVRDLISDELDTPGLVEADARAGELGSATQRLVEQYDKLTAKIGRIDVAEVWEDDRIVRALATRARDLDAIVWYRDRAIAQRLADLGLPVWPVGGSPQCARPEAVALSIPSHGTGLNLQAWDRNLVLQPPASGEVWEQLIGRTHRQGQTSDAVTVQWVNPHPIVKSAVAKARQQAQFAQSVRGQAQKLCLATELSKERI